MLVLNPNAGPSRLPQRQASRRATSKRSQKITKKCTCFLLTSLLPASIAQGTRKPSPVNNDVPPFYTFNGSDWVESGDWALNGRHGSDWQVPSDSKMLQDNLPTDSLTSTSATPTSSNPSRPTFQSSFTPFNNGKRDRTSFYAVPLIIVFSVILFSCLVILLFGTLFYWKRKRAYKRRRRAIESDEGYGEGVESEKDEPDEKFEKKSKAGKRRLKYFFKTKAMTRFKGQRPQLIVASTTAMEDSASLRRRRSRRQSPSISRTESIYQTEREEESPVVAQTAQQASRRSSPAPQSIASERSATPEPTCSTVVEPPAYTHGRSPSYSRGNPPPRSARQSEKQRMVEPAEDARQEEQPPTIDEEVEQERMGVSGHIATDDKAVLEARRQFASMPATTSAAGGGEASAPHITLDMEGFEQHEESNEDFPISSEEVSSPFPAPPTALQHSFMGMSTASDEALAPSAPDLELQTDIEEEASAPMEDDLCGDMESVIQSSSSVGWLPSYEATSSRSTRIDHTVV